MWEFVNLSSFVMQLINMGIIIYILNRFLFKPYLEFIEWEDKKRVELDTAYEEMNILKQKAEVEASNIVESAKAEANNIRANMEVLANQEREKILNDATEESKEIINYAEQKAKNTEASMLELAKWKIIGLVLKLNSKIFSKEPVNRDFLEKELQTLTK